MATSERKRWFQDGNGLRVAYDGMPSLRAALARLARDEVLVGFPEETTGRPPSAEDPQGKITNASLGYIHDNGAPEAKIPARPFMVPGIERVRDAATKVLAKSAEYALAGDTAKVDEGFQRVGILAVSALRGVIQDGIMPPLSDYTVRKRAAKGRKGAKAEMARREAGYGPSDPGAGLVTPLMDTNEMVKSINYAVRPRAARKK